MAGVVEAVLTMSVTALCDGRPELAAEVKLREREIDRQEVKIERECLRVLALYEPVASDFRRVLTVLRVNRDLERISDLSARIAKRAGKLAVRPTPVAIPEPLETLAAEALEAVRNALDALAKSDSAAARAVITGDREIDRCRGAVRDGPDRVDPPRPRTDQRLAPAPRHRPPPRTRRRPRRRDRRDRRLPQRRADHPPRRRRPAKTTRLSRQGSSFAAEPTSASSEPTWYAIRTR